MPSSRAQATLLFESDLGHSYERDDLADLGIEWRIGDTILSATSGVLEVVGVDRVDAEEDGAPLALWTLLVRAR